MKAVELYKDGSRQLFTREGRNAWVEPHTSQAPVGVSKEGRVFVGAGTRCTHVPRTRVFSYGAEAWCGRCGGWLGIEPVEKGAAKPQATKASKPPKSPRKAQEPLSGARSSGEAWSVKRRAYKLQTLLEQEPEEYRRTFLEQNWPPPWTCFWCGAGVAYKRLTVHHYDGNHDNNDFRNLYAAHKDCHWAAHDAEERGAQRALAALATTPQPERENSGSLILA